MKDVEFDKLTKVLEGVSEEDQFSRLIPRRNAASAFCSGFAAPR